MTSLVFMRYFLGIEGFKSILKCHRVISEEFEMTDLVLIRLRESTYNSKFNPSYWVISYDIPRSRKEKVKNRLKVQIRLN